METVFLDCGSNFGQGFEEICGRFNIVNPKAYMFEPNPHCFARLKQKFPQHHLYNQAVWNKDEVRTLNMEFYSPENAPVGGAGNIMQENFVRPPWVSSDNMGEWPPKHGVEVQCIDLSSFIKREINKGDNVVMKLDIEGAELEVLDKMIEDKTLEYVKHIIIEWHFHMRKTHTTRTFEDYLKIFSELGIQYTQWY